ncbi:MAG: biopolymer transport protein ExbD [Planctomycetota bacterium]|jgi:biopolymer transport protein ExbD
MSNTRSRSTASQLNDEVCEMEMTPMIDVTFLLLIFFIVTLKFKVLEGKLSAYLPKDVGPNPNEAEQPDKVTISLRVLEPGTKLRADGKTPYNDPSGADRFVWGPDRVVEYGVGANRTTDPVRLLEILERVYSRRDDLAPATIDALPGTSYGDVVPLLDMAVAAGFTDITFVGARPDERP